MDSPSSVSNAVLAIWIVAVISGLASFAASLAGEISTEECLFRIFCCSLFCILPYKIGAGSNIARYFFVILLFTGLITLFSDKVYLNYFDLVMVLLSTPLELFALVNLFKLESSEWFENNKKFRLLKRKS